MHPAGRRTLGLLFPVQRRGESRFGSPVPMVMDDETERPKAKGRKEGIDFRYHLCRRLRKEVHIMCFQLTRDVWEEGHLLRRQRGG